MSNPFEALGLDEAASPEAISLAYRTLARTLHPDAGGNAEDFNNLREAAKEATAMALRRPCPGCLGAGTVSVQTGFHVTSMTCPACGGTGKFHNG